MLGLQPVGWIFSHADERDAIQLSARDVVVGAPPSLAHLDEAALSLSLSDSRALVAAQLQRDAMRLYGREKARLFATVAIGVPTRRAERHGSIFRTGRSV